MTTLRADFRGGADADASAAAPLAGNSGLWRDIFLYFLVTRLLLLITAMVAMKYVPVAVNDVVWNGSSHWWINAWGRWDALHYVAIARSGYVYQPNVATNIAFAPLYSLLIRALSVVVGQTDQGRLLSGMILSNGFLLVALYYFARLIRLDYDADVAERAALYVLVFPTTLFFSAVYPMSLAFAITAATFYYARRGNWWLAGLGAGVGALARNEGVVIVLALVYEYLEQRNFRLQAVRADVLALGIAPLVFLGYAYTLYRISGVPLLIFSAGRAWGRKLTPPWQLLHMHHSLVDVAAVLLYLALIVLCVRWRVRRSYVLFAAMYFLILLSSGLLNSFLRYGLLLFPAFIALALAGRNPRFDRLCLVVSAGLACLNMALFALWYPAG